MIDRILRWLFYQLFFLTPLVMYPATSEIFEFNKLLFIYGSTALIVFFWGLKMILNRKIILKKTPLDVPIMFFIGTLILSTIFSIDVHTSIFGYYGRFNGGLLSILCYIILFYGFVSNEIDVKKSLIWSLASSVVVVLWGLPGHFGKDLTCPTFNTILTSMSGKIDGATLNSIWTTKFNNSCWSRETNVFDPASRMFSTLGQPNWLGAYLAMNFFIGVYFFLKKRDSIFLAIVNAMYLFLNFSGILFSRSRSAMMAVALGVTVMAIYLFIKKTKKLTLYAVLLALVILIPVIFFKTGIGQIDRILEIGKAKKTQMVESPKNQPTPPSEVTESFDIRRIVWKGAWNLGLKYPLTGTGVETFAYSYFFERPQSHNMTTEWDFIYNKAHNEYLNYLATTGFTGLLSYLGFIVVFVVYSVKLLNEPKPSKKNKNAVENDDLLIVTLLVSWSTALVTNFFGFSTTTISLLTFLIPAITIVSVSKRLELKSADSQSGQIFKGIAIFILSGVTIYSLVSISSYFSADINYGQGLYYSKPQVSDYQKAAFYFQEALKRRVEPVYEDKLSYALAYLSGIASYQKNEEVTSQLITASEYYSIKSLRSSPKNVLYWKTRAKNKYLYYLADKKTEQLDEGIESLIKAKELSPTDPKIYYSLAVFYSLKYDLEKDRAIKSEIETKTLAELDKSIALKKDFYDGYFLKGQFLKKVGKNEEARKVFEFILSDVKPNDQPTVQQLDMM